jgi:hypothetical protein
MFSYSFLIVNVRGFIGVPRMIQHYQKRIGASRYLNYYKGTEIVDMLGLDFHRPFVLQEQDSLETQSLLSKIFPLENREMPIL